MLILNKKINTYIFINCFLIVFAVFAFLMAIFSFGYLDQDSTQTVDINTVAFYLRFLTADSEITILNLAFHNFGLALVAYILSMLSFGILGLGSLCSAFFVAGQVFSCSFDFFTFIFTGLELSGMCLSVFGGAYIFYKRRKFHVSLKNVLFFSIKLILALVIIYFLAAYIEAYFIQNIMKGL